MTGLQIQLLGGFAVRAAGSRVRPFPTRKTRALLVYLALQPGQDQSRANLAALLWPDAEPRRAAHNLRQALASLRQGLDRYQAAAALTVDRYQARFNPTANCQVDLLLMAAELAEATIPALHQAVARYQGPLMAGFDLPAAPEFAAWLAAERERWEAELLGALEQLATHYQAQGAFTPAEAAWRQAVAIDPWHEGAHRELMRLLALSGDSAGALAQYARCREALQQGLAVEPLPETVALAAQIRAGQLPLPPRDNAGLTLPFAGRGPEHAHLARLLPRRRSGRSESATPHLALLAGPAGIGKSRLLAEFARYAASHSALILTGRCLDFTVPLPYDLFVAPLRAALAGLRTPLAPAWQTTLARLLPELGEAAPAGADEAARTRLFAAVAALLAGAAPPGQPILLLLDDLHWADQSSLDLLHYLLYHGPDRLLILGAYRPEDSAAGAPLTRLYRRLSRDGRASQLELAPLTAKAIQTITATLVTAAQAPDLAAYLWQESAGNPFILRELLHELADTHALDARPWQLPPDWRTGLSRLTDRLRDLVLERVERLPPASQADLQKAAILGAQFDLTLLAAMQPASDLPAALQLWQRRGLIRPDGDQFEFAHDKIREVLLERLPPAHKTAWHELAAAALQQHRPAASRALAHHHYHGPEPARALPYLLAGVETAAHALAYAEVRQLCQQALALAPPAGMRRQFLAWRQLAHQFLGDTAAEGADALALVTAAQAEGDSQQLAQAVQRLARFYYLRGEVSAARQAIEGVLQAARSAGDLETSVRLLDMMAMLFRETPAGQAEALRLQAEALALAVEGDDERLQGLIQADTAVILAEKGAWGEALTRASAGVTHLRQPELPRYLPHALYIHGSVLRGVGQYAAAAPALAEALALCQAHQLQTYLVQVLLEQGQLGLESGRLAEAEAAFNQVLQLARQGGRPLIVARALLGLGQTAYEGSAFARAQEQLAAGLAIDTAERPGLTAALQAASALALLGLNRPAAAEPQAAAALASLNSGEYVLVARDQIAFSQIMVWQATRQAEAAQALRHQTAARLRAEAATLPAAWQEPFLQATPWRRHLTRA